MAADYREALNDPNDDLNKFDTASGGDDLAAFDEVTGVLHIPAGPYVCTVVSGELTSTKDGKRAYRLAFDVADGPHRGHRVWRWYMLDTRLAMNRAKQPLSRLGIQTQADLKKVFPEPGRVITVRALLTVKEWKGESRNDVERFEVIDDRTAPPNPNAVDPDKLAGSEGGAG